LVTEKRMTEQAPFVSSFNLCDAAILGASSAGSSTRPDDDEIAGITHSPL